MADDLRALYKGRFDGDLEPERYEIFELLDDLSPDRRAFLRLLGGGLFFLVNVRTEAQEVPVRVQVAEDGTVRAFTGKTDMGQGTRTLLTQAFAEELALPVARVHLVMGDTSLCPDDGGTWSSLTTPQTVPVIRAAAAAVRARRSGGDPTLTAPDRWTTLGTSVPAVDGIAIVTGAKHFPSDVTAPGVLHAAVVRAPHHRARLSSFDASAVDGRDGVRVLRDGDLLAAVADTPQRARHAAARVSAVWAAEALAPQEQWAAQFKASAVAPTSQPNARYPPLLEHGTIDAALEGATRRLSSSYWVSPIAHVPLEPRAAVASWADGEVTIHSGPQAPFLVRQELARALDVPEARVRVISVDPGGAYGGKQRGECEVEAARLARLAGAPVRVAWSREEEFTCSYTRPAGLVEIESGVDREGRLTALRFANYNSGAAGLRPQYDVPNHWIGFYRTSAVVRQGSYRALAAVANNFALESHIDEWAQALGEDPVAFRLRHVTDSRLREVIEATASRFGWGATRTGPGRGIGFSCNLEKDARLALCVEIEATGSQVRLLRMVATGDFGAALNPDALQNQMSGALIQGVGGALWEQVHYDTSSQRTRHLADYRVPRFSDVPAIDVRIIDRRGIASAGAGESPMTLPAPALAAAYWAATGIRRRSLPLLTAGQR